MTAQALQSLAGELARVERVWVVAAGKAALGMARAAAAALGEKVVAGLVTVDAGPSLGRELGAQWQAFPASHPLPSDASEAAGRAALGLASLVTGPKDQLLVCLSGGASAMLSVPAEGLTRDDKIGAARAMLRGGLDISEMNLVRRHLSGIKGGQLAAAAFQTITLAISDVCAPVDDDPVVIGSGPTVGDPTTFAEAVALLERASLVALMPPAVLAHLRAGAAGQVPGPVRPDDPRLQRSAYWIVASRHEAMRAAADTARRIGYHVEVRTPATLGEAREAAGPIVHAADGRTRPACVISSGETTVHVHGTGRGGRNQEVAVAALEALASREPAALASIGTDGVDGPTDAAGAIVDAGMWTALGKGARATCADALDRNDTYPLLDRLGALVKTGPTGTNVGDVQVLLLARRSDLE